MRNRRRGSISLSGLAGLYVIVALLPLTVMIFAALADLRFDYYELENELAVCQLRRILLISYDLDIGNDRLDFTYHDDDYELREVNGHLILTPGTQIFLEDIEYATFEERGGVVYVHCYHRNKEYSYPLCSAKRLRVADFPADLLEQSDSDGSEPGSGLYGF